MKGFRRLGVLAVIIAGMIVSWAPLSVAAPAAAPTYLRVAQLSPDSKAMDVYVVASVADRAATFTLPEVAYGTISEYRSMPAATYTVSIRPGGAAADSPPLIATTFTARPGAAYTLAGVGHYAELGLTVFDDDLAGPAPGQSRVRIINAAATAPMVDLSIADGPTLATGVGFAKSTGYRPVPAGALQLLVKRPGGADTQLPLQMDPGAVYTVLLVDRSGKLAAELHPDSVGSMTEPLGGVETGYGGAAGSSGIPGPGLLLAGAVVVVASLAMALRPRSRGRHGRT